MKNKVLLYTHGKGKLGKAEFLKFIKAILGRKP